MKQTADQCERIQHSLKHIQRISEGVEALDALAIMIPDTIDQESTVSTDQICALLKCVSQSIKESNKQLHNVLQENKE